MRLPQKLSSSSTSPLHRGCVASALSALVIFSGLVSPPSASLAATDGAAIGKCLLTNPKTQPALARCVTDPVCIANLLCIQTCTGRADEADCQINCGDKFANSVTESFTKAAVTDTACVPQRQDDGSWPVPKTSALVPEFKPSDLAGDWYITAGLNRDFDTFDCQLHKFKATETTLTGDLQWRIQDPVAGKAFVTKYTVQEFIQDEKNPAILYNHDNEFLHYQDDWYVLAHRPQKYVVVYYRGSNDAWDGYGGAVVYSRDAAFPKEYTDEVDASLRKVGLKFADFQLTDNSCKPNIGRLEELEADLEFVSTRAAGTVQFAENRVLKGLYALEEAAVAEAIAIEEAVVGEIVTLEKEVEGDVLAIEKEVAKDFKSIFPKWR